MLVLFVVLPLVAACGDTSSSPADAGQFDAAGDGGGDGAADASGEGGKDSGGLGDLVLLDGSAQTMAELCARQAALICANVVSCCASVLPVAADLAACKQGVSAACVKGGKKEEAAIAAGTAEIDPLGLAACEVVGAAAGQACRLGTSAAELETCSNVVFAKAQVGQDCAAGLGGARCAAGAGICFAEPTGVPCKAWGKAGELCSKAPCAPGLLCILGVQPSDPAFCSAPRKQGEACPADAYCAAGLSCESKVCALAGDVGAACGGKPSKCLPQLTCGPFSETCIPRRPVGGPCYLSGHCELGLACHGVGTMGQVCLPGTPQDGSDAPGLPQDGELCTGLCAKGFVCKEGPLPGKCVPALCAAVAEALP